MRVQVERREFFAFKQFDLRDNENCFPAWRPFAGPCFALMGISFSCLSALTHRLINWKPRRFATHWTPCGTRRSLIVESQRKTCTAKHSGKCLEASVLFISFLSEDRRILSHRSPFWLSTISSLHPLSFFTWLPFFCPSIEHLSPSVLHISPVLTTFPLLNPSPPSLFSLLLLLLKLQWQIEVSLNTAGSFNFIDLTLWRWWKLWVVSGCE